MQKKPHWLANLIPFSIEDLSSALRASKPSFSKSESGPRSSTSSTPFFPSLTCHIKQKRDKGLNEHYDLYIIWWFWLTMVKSFWYSYLWGEERKLGDGRLDKWAFHHIWNTVESLQACIRKECSRIASTESRFHKITNKTFDQRALVK